MGEAQRTVEPRRAAASMPSPPPSAAAAAGEARDGASEMLLPPLPSLPATAEVATLLGDLRSRQSTVKVATLRALAAAVEGTAPNVVASSQGGGSIGGAAAKCDREQLHKLAHDNSLPIAARDHAAAVLAAIIADTLQQREGTDSSDQAAAAHLLRRHAFALSFERRSTDSLGPVVPLLIPLLQGGEPSIGRKEAAGAIMNLAWRSANNADVACSAGVLSLLSQLAGRADADSAEIENAAGALLNIVAHSGDGSISRARIVYNSGAVRLAWARLLRTGKNKWSRLGCKLLTEILRGDSDFATNAAAEAMSTGKGTPWDQMLQLGTKPNPKSNEVETQVCALAAISAVAKAMQIVSVSLVRDVITEERYQALNATPLKLLPLLTDRRLVLAEAAAK